MMVRSARANRPPTRMALVAATALLAVATTHCGIPRREGWELAPLPGGRAEVVRLTSGPTLEVERVRFFSNELGEPRFFLAIVPAGRQGIGDVFILNHGWTDRPEDMLRALKVDRVYEELLAAGEVKPAVVVLPDIRSTEYHRRNSEKFPFPSGLVLVAEEVAQLVSQRYGVPWDRTRWGIGGFSFGGYTALDVVRRYSGRFGSASVISAFADEAWTFWPSREPPPGRLDGRGRGKQTLVVPGPAPRLLLACGTGDRLFPAMRSLHERLSAEGIAHQWMTAPGGHTWKYWATVLRPMLRFHLAPDQASTRRGPAPPE